MDSSLDDNSLPQHTPVRKLEPVVCSPDLATMQRKARRTNRAETRIEIPTILIAIDKPIGAAGVSKDDAYAGPEVFLLVDEGFSSFRTSCLDGESMIQCRCGHAYACRYY